MQETSKFCLFIDFLEEKYRVWSITFTQLLTEFVTRKEKYLDKLSSNFRPFSSMFFIVMLSWASIHSPKRLFQRKNRLFFNFFFAISLRADNYPPSRWNQFWCQSLFPRLPAVNICLSSVFEDQWYTDRTFLECEENKKFKMPYVSGG